MTDIQPLTEQQARALTDRIKVAVEGTWLLIQEAYTTRAWHALGYESWDAYCAAEFRTAHLGLPREERQEVVASLRDSGLSTRAIGAATGVSHTQIRKDLRGAGGNLSREDAGQDAAGFPPGSVIGIDGKSYAATRPAPLSDDALLAGEDWVQPAGPDFEDMVTAPATARPAAAPDPVKPKRRPLPDALTDAGRDLARAAERLARLAEDDRFPRNRETAHHQVPELLGALDNAVRLIQAMRLETAEASEEARHWWATSLNTLSDALRGVAQSINKEH